MTEATQLTVPISYTGVTCFECVQYLLQHHTSVGVGGAAVTIVIQSQLDHLMLMMSSHTDMGSSLE